ncbi:MAG TPA: HlyD family efflux transporter periplasmic adaptor subunit, partial [Gemmatimonadales bacterium]
IVVLIAAAIVYAVWRQRATTGDLAASGTVEATEVALGFQVPGRIESVGPHEGDRVTVGQELARLDRTELEARKAQAEAMLSGAKALLGEMEAGARSEELAQAREAARAAGERFTDAQRDYDRAERLLTGGAVSQEVYDKAKVTLTVAQSQRDQADQQLKLVETGPRPERIAGQRAAVLQAEAAVRQADAALANAVIVSPLDGVVTIRQREPGETVGAGSPVLTVVNLADRWVRIYVREDAVGAVRLGQAATITADAYRGKTYPGVVSFISSQAEFTPRNVQTTEERVKLVYAVKVRVTGDAANDLKPGMPADVSLAPRQP